MQLMPRTAESLGVEDAFDPAQNLDGGARHLGQLLTLYGGDLAEALAAYNAGEGAVRPPRRGAAVPRDARLREEGARALPAGRRSRDASTAGRGGLLLVALLAAVAVMMIMLAAAVPSWRYVMRNDAEEELLFRGGEIADAVARYQRKNGNALPPSLEVLVKGKYLRRAVQGPDDEARALARSSGPAKPVAPVAPAVAGTSGTSTVTTTTTTTTRPSAFSTSGQLGGFQGVASTSTEKSLRVFNGRTQYNEWVFLPGQPRVVGRPVGPAMPRPGSCLSAARPPSSEQPRRP